MANKATVRARELGQQAASATVKPAAKKASTKKASTTKTAASTTLGYKPPAYDETKYSKGVNTSYYTNAIKDYTKQANADRQFQLAEAQKAQRANVKQAYVNRVQNQVALNNNLAMAGIRGGATETSSLRLANQYGNALAQANTDYANSVSNINRSVDQNIRDYTSDMRSRAEEYRQNQMNARWQAAREDYNNRFNAAREDRTNETARQTEYWSNYYINKYSGYGKKDLKKAEKEIKANLKKAKTAYEKIRWQQALAGIGARRGVIATSK